MLTVSVSFTSKDQVSWMLRKTNTMFSLIKKFQRSKLLPKKTTRFDLETTSYVGEIIICLFRNDCSLNIYNICLFRFSYSLSVFTLYRLLPFIWHPVGSREWVCWRCCCTSSLLNIINCYLKWDKSLVPFFYSYAFLKKIILAFLSFILIAWTMFFLLCRI